MFICIFWLLCACSDKKQTAITFTFDYEQAYGWMDLNLEKGIAHSGVYCERLTADKEYSHGFTLPLTQIHTAPVKKMNASVWVTATEMTAPVYLILDVFIPGSNEHLIFFQKDLSPFLKKKGGWRLATAEIDLTAIKARNAMIKVYVWNRERQNIWLDDFTVKFEPSI